MKKNKILTICILISLLIISACSGNRNTMIKKRNRKCKCPTFSTNKLNDERKEQYATSLYMEEFSIDDKKNDYPLYF